MLRAVGRSPDMVSVLARSGVAVSAGADTNENTLATITVPAGAMGDSGSVRVTCVFSYTNSGNSKTLRVKFGGVTYASQGATTTAIQSFIVGISNRTNATQVGWFPINPNQLSGQSGSPITSSVDTTAAVTILITGQKATAGETLTLERYSVELLP
jgi:hypothetical protein